MLHKFNTKAPHIIGVYNPNECSRVANWDNLKYPLREETQFFNASPSFIQHNKEMAPITHHILQNVFRDKFEDNEYHHLQVNTFVHKLGREGMYPNVPGWHCDYFHPTYEDEKIIVDEDENIQHWLIVLGDNTPTLQFIDERDIVIDFTSASWGEVSRLIDRRVAKQHLKTYTCAPGEILNVAGNELYRSMPSLNKCWRYFFRITQYPEYHRCRPSTGTPGHIRKLQMVYVDCHGGW